MVRIMTSRRFLTDSITAPTMVLSPVIIIIMILNHTQILCNINMQFKPCIPGTIATVFKARSTLNVLKAAKFPRFMPIVTYLRFPNIQMCLIIILTKYVYACIKLNRLACIYARVITTKSSQFQASRRYVNGSKMNPLAITFTADSKVYMAVNRTL